VLEISAFNKAPGQQSSVVLRGELLHPVWPPSSPEETGVASGTPRKTALLSQSLPLRAQDGSSSSSTSSSSSSPSSSQSKDNAFTAHATAATLLASAEERLSKGLEWEMEDVGPSLLASIPIDSQSISETSSS
jgi:hypothetical protein